MTETILAPRTTGFEIRAVGEDELRTANTVFHEALHEEPVEDEKWDVTRRCYELDRTFGAYSGDTLVGTTTSLTSAITVPGGAQLPMAAVTAVGVRTDFRRRGALTGLMRHQLLACAEAGEAVATLHASEPTIYGRFGYGQGTMAQTVKVRSEHATLRPEVPVAGTMRLLDRDEALTVLPEAYRRFQHTRPGMMARGEAWWVLNYERRYASRHMRVAAHVDAGGRIDGMVQYRVVELGPGDPRGGYGLFVLDFAGADQGVHNDLWRFLLDMDLITEITAYVRPTDDPVTAMVVNPAMVRTEGDEELWVRLVDVPAALAARTYGAADPVVVEIVDPLLPANSGRYLIGPHGMEPTTAPAALTLGAESLGMVYFGAWRVSQLAGIGRVVVTDPAALPAADRLFATDRPSWCGSLF